MRTSNLSSKAALALATVFAIGGFSSAAQAQQETGNVNSTPKGIIGGALLGMEAGTFVESLAGVRNGWVYLVSDVVLGAGGAVGGWEVEQTSSNGTAPVMMLAGGLGLAIPAIVLTLNALSTPAESASEDNAPTNAPPANPGAPGKSIVGPSAPAAAPAAAPHSQLTPAPSNVHLSLVDVNRAGLHLGVPVPEVRPVFSMSELRQYGFAQQTEVRMPLVQIAF
jgi:hypothetical protein